MATFEIDEKRFDIIKEAVSCDCIEVSIKQSLAMQTVIPQYFSFWLTGQNSKIVVFIVFFFSLFAVHEVFE